MRVRGMAGVLVVFAAFAGTGAVHAAASPEGEPDEGPLKLLRTAALPGVRGRIDHLARDAGRGRLFVAALGNGTVEVVSLAKFEREMSIPGLEEPQGIAFVEAADVLAVACGGDGSVRFFDGAKLAPASTVKLSGDADNVRWNAATKRLWVAFGSGGLARIDAARTSDPPLVVPLDAHPEGFQVEAAGARAFVNLAARNEVAVCDLAGKKVTARWKPGTAGSNFPMALDEAAKRLYVGCRAPAQLVVLSTEDGKVLATADCGGDPDDVFLDLPRKRAHVICGSGEVDVFDLGAKGPELRAKVTTARGARTGLLEGDRLWIAVPARGPSEAEVREYELR